MELNDWIRAARQRLGWSQERLAIALSTREREYTKAVVSGWETGRWKPSSMETLAKISELAQMPLPAAIRGTDVAIAGTGAKRIPLLSPEALETPESLERAIQLSAESPRAEAVLYEGLASALAFAFRIKDRAMAPDILDRDIVIADPTVPPSPGSFVICSFKTYNNRTESAAVRRYRQSATGFDLVPHNSDYASVSSDVIGPGMSLMASVLHLRRDFRPS